MLATSVPAVIGVIFASILRLFRTTDSVVLQDLSVKELLFKNAQSSHFRETLFRLGTRLGSQRSSSPSWQSSAMQSLSNTSER
jgi:hypothetical protein